MGQCVAQSAVFVFCCDGMCFLSCLDDFCVEVDNDNFVCLFETLLQAKFAKCQQLNFDSRLHKKRGKKDGGEKNEAF